MNFLIIHIVKSWVCYYTIYKSIWTMIIIELQPLARTLVHITTYHELLDIALSQLGIAAFRIFINSSYMVFTLVSVVTPLLIEIVF